MGKLGRPDRLEGTLRNTQNAEQHVPKSMMPSGQWTVCRTATPHEITSGDLFCQQNAAAPKRFQNQEIPNVDNFRGIT
jgi:hypothetical protein